MRRVIFSGTFSARAVDRKPTRVSSHFGIVVAGCLLLTGCRTVELPAPPIIVTTVAVPVVEARDAVEAPEVAEALDVLDSPDAVGVAPGSIPARVWDTRGLWVVRSTLVHPDSVRAMVARAADAGFNTLLVQVRGRGDAYYSDGIEPRADGIQDDPTFDPLALTVREAHARGIEVHAWINVHLVSSAVVISRAPTHLVNEHPELLAVPRGLARELYDVDPAHPRYRERLVEYALANRGRVEGLYSSPSAPEVKERVYSVATDLVERYDIDGIHLDYIRYPSGAFDYSRAALDRFRTWIDQRITDDQRAELAVALEQSPLALVEAFPEPWADFRRNQITDLVERIYVGVKRRRPEVLVSAAVFPDARESFINLYQDWEGWLRRGIIDVVAPMAYNPDDGLFEVAISSAAGVVGPERVWAGVGVHLTTFEGTLSKIEIARRLGVRGFLLFSYDWSVAYGAASGGEPFLERVGRGSQTLNR
ncbi:MAG: family 10 glycosylhydrolase [Gemmatimonadetes bacterium]|nr:family 10 glycosylhydrolase [Gemmatimonadota bacterium]MCH8811566.1 family 10 glycosylhydrolase [Gemmatimonadota bacterium]